MKIGASAMYAINTKSVIECVNELEKAGFKAIELVYEYDHFLTYDDIMVLKNKDLDFSMHGPFVNLGLLNLDPEFVEPQLKLVERSLAAAVNVGCTHYVMHGGKIPSLYLAVENPKTRDFFIDLFIKRLGDLFRKYSKEGMKITIENLPSAKDIGGEPSDIIKIQQKIPEVGFCFDIAHAEVMGQTSEILNSIKIDHIHVSDNNLKVDDHFVVGEGKIDFKRIISDVKDKGFDGKLILENSSFEDTRVSLENLKKLI